MSSGGPMVVSMDCRPLRAWQITVLLVATLAARSAWGAKPALEMRYEARAGTQMMPLVTDESRFRCIASPRQAQLERRLGRSALRFYRQPKQSACSAAVSGGEKAGNEVADVPLAGIVLWSQERSGKPGTPASVVLIPEFFDEFGLRLEGRF